MGKKRVITKKCKEHDITEFVLDYRDYYRCRKCRVVGVQKRRTKLKKELVRMHGEKCIMCGYNKVYKILEFHHINPSEKEFSLSMRATISLKRLIKESKKCVLLCPTCHREVHVGMIKSPKKTTFIKY